MLAFNCYRLRFGIAVPTEMLELYTAAHSSINTLKYSVIAQVHCVAFSTCKKQEAQLLLWNALSWNFQKIRYHSIQQCQSSKISVHYSHSVDNKSTRCTPRGGICTPPNFQVNKTLLWEEGAWFQSSIEGVSIFLGLKLHYPWLASGGFYIVNKDKFVYIADSVASKHTP